MATTSPHPERPALTVSTTVPAAAGAQPTFADSPTQEPPEPSIPIPKRDGGYIPRDSSRRLVDGAWKIEKDASKRVVEDVYDDRGTFNEEKSSVQIVTFFKNQERPPIWDEPVTDPEEVKRRLEKPIEAGTWRWVHVEGLHGPTMKTVAIGTGWDPVRFAGIFSWTRPSAELIGRHLLVHYVDQATDVWMFCGGNADREVVVTCTKQDPRKELKTRWEDFVDFGDSRPNLLLRTDPSLMLYGMTRAFIQDLRATASENHNNIADAYKLALSRPSQRSLSYFYQLQDRLIRIKLDTTALRDALSTLIRCSRSVYKDGDKPFVKDPLVSKDTLYMLADQLSLVHLLSEEIPEMTRQAEAVSTLAFNSLTFNTNNLLKLLAILTIASVPLTVASSVLGINAFDSSTVSTNTVGIVMGSVAGAVVVGLVVFLLWSYARVGQKRHADERTRREKVIRTWNALRKDLKQKFKDLEAQNEQERQYPSKKFTMRPDVYATAEESAIPMPEIPRTSGRFSILRSPTSFGRNPTSPVGVGSHS